MICNLVEILTPSPSQKVDALPLGSFGRPGETSDERRVAEALGQLLAALLATKPTPPYPAQVSPGDGIAGPARPAGQGELYPNAQSMIGVARHLDATGPPQLWSALKESIPLESSALAPAAPEIAESRSAPEMHHSMVLPEDALVASSAPNALFEPFASALPAEPVPAATIGHQLSLGPLPSNQQRGLEDVVRMFGETAPESAIALPTRSVPSVAASAVPSAAVPQPQAKTPSAPPLQAVRDDHLRSEPQEVPAPSKTAIAKGEILEVTAQGPQAPNEGRQAKETSVGSRVSGVKVLVLRDPKVGPQPVEPAPEGPMPMPPEATIPQEAKVEPTPTLSEAMVPQEVKVEATPTLPKVGVSQEARVDAMPVLPDAGTSQEAQVEAVPKPPKATVPQETKVEPMPVSSKASVPEVAKDEAMPAPLRVIPQGAQGAKGDEAARWGQAPRHPRQTEAEGVGLPMTTKPLVGGGLSQEAPVETAPVFPREVVTQITSALHMASLRQGDWSIRLRSEYLGNIEVKAAVDAEGFLSVTLLTQSHRVEEMMQAHLPQLHQVLTENGFDPQRLSLRVGSQATTSDPGANFFDQRHPAQGFARPFIRDGMFLPATGKEPRWALWYGDWRRANLIDYRA